MGLVGAVQIELVKLEFSTDRIAVSDGPELELAP
jgi:hypothetical protein